jgi:serine/threonine protein kinase
MPFSDDDQGQLYSRIQKGIFSFPENLFAHTSQEARDLITQLLTVDPKRRLTVHQALEHPWMLMIGKENETPAQTTLDKTFPERDLDKDHRGVDAPSADLFEIDNGH